MAEPNTTSDFFYLIINVTFMVSIFYNFSGNKTKLGVEFRNSTRNVTVCLYTGFPLPTMLCGKNIQLLNNTITKNDFYPIKIPRNNKSTNELISNKL